VKRQQGGSDFERLNVLLETRLGRTLPARGNAPGASKKSNRSRKVSVFCLTPPGPLKEILQAFSAATVRYNDVEPIAVRRKQELSTPEIPQLLPSGLSEIEVYSFLRDGWRGKKIERGHYKGSDGVGRLLPGLFTKNRHSKGIYSGREIIYWL